MGPLVFDPVYQPYVWGGRKLSTYRSDGIPPAGPIAESWEISTRVEGMSVVAAGPHKGKTLAELVPDLPLLFKILDAKQHLSLQVHPDDARAAEFGGEAKNEMWGVLDAEPGAGVYLGFNEDATRDSIDAALATGTLAEKLAFYPASAGDVFWVPGGRVHAIGAGCLLYEVQQNSNTTYRLDDWGRMGVDGKPRELHLDAGRQVIDFSDTAPARMTATPIACADPGLHGDQLLTCPYFSLERWTVAAGAALPERDGGMAALFVVEGSWCIPDLEVPPLRSVLFPTSSQNEGVAGAAGATVLLTRFG